MATAGVYAVKLQQASLLGGVQRDYRLAA